MHCEKNQYVRSVNRKAISGQTAQDYRYQRMRMKHRRKALGYHQREDLKGNRLRSKTRYGVRMIMYRMRNHGVCR